MELARQAGAKRVARLGVSIASHSPLMARANATFNEAVGALPLRPPQIPVIGNVTAKPLVTEADIRDELRWQMERPVDWTGTIQEFVRSGTTTFVELGPGNVLAGLIRRIDRSSTLLSLTDLGIDTGTSNTGTSQ
jgi:[acyl-carrier-protein] S-malonyltransferase